MCTHLSGNSVYRPLKFPGGNPIIRSIISFQRNLPPPDGLWPRVLGSNPPLTLFRLILVTSFSNPFLFYITISKACKISNNVFFKYSQRYPAYVSENLPMSTVIICIESDVSTHYRCSWKLFPGVANSH